MTIAPSPQRRKPNHTATALSLCCAALFLWLAFRGVELDRVWSEIKHVSALDTFFLFFLAATGVVLRAWRWWYTLPRPHKTGEFMASLRALGIGYAINNAIPRLGEVIRVMVLARRSKRDVAQLASTVVIDRFLLDLLALSALFAMGMMFARDDLLRVMGDRVAAANALMALAILGLIGMMSFAAKPAAYKRALEWLGAKRLGPLWQKVSDLIDQLSAGMVVMTEPRKIIIILLQTILIWASYIAFFVYALRLFDIQVSWGTTLVIYAITVLGIALPSPGGVGTFHFFTRLSLTQLAAVEPLKATSVATYMHGINYFGLIVIGLIAFIIETSLSRRVGERDKLSPEEQP